MDDLKSENAKLREALWKLNEVSKRESESMQKHIQDLQSKCERVDVLDKENHSLKSKAMDMQLKIEDLQQVIVLTIFSSSFVGYAIHMVDG